MALSNTEFAYRRNATQPARPADPLSAVNKSSHEEIGRERLLAAVEVYRMLETGDNPDPTQPQPERHCGIM